jgi:hypothetical protein
MQKVVYDSVKKVVYDSVLLCAANHLIQCSKRTAYASKPDVKWIEYDDEHEEYNPFDDAAAAAEGEVTTVCSGNCRHVRTLHPLRIEC